MDPITAEALKVLQTDSEFKERVVARIENYLPTFSDWDFPDHPRESLKPTAEEIFDLFFKD